MQLMWQFMRIVYYGDLDIDDTFSYICLIINAAEIQLGVIDILQDCKKYNKLCVYVSIVFEFYNYDMICVQTWCLIAAVRLA